MATEIQSGGARGRGWDIPVAFACVYLFWGSTYTAIKVAAPFLPALVLTGTRFLFSGSLMLAYCRLRGLKLFGTLREMGWLAVIGILLLGLNNLALVASEQSLPSGLAALIVAVVPLYVALAGQFLPGGERLRRMGWVGVLLGLVGLAVLLAPSIRLGLRHAKSPIGGALILLAGVVPWVTGSILSRRLRLPVHVLVAAGWQMLFAGLMNSSLATLRGDWPRAQWTHAAIDGVTYLVVFGSLVGYTAYIYLLKHVPVPKVSTYAYVNPLVAVGLGAIFLGERLVFTEYVGMVLVLLAVALLTSSQIKGPAVETAEEPGEVRGGMDREAAAGKTGVSV